MLGTKQIVSKPALMPHATCTCSKPLLWSCAPHAATTGLQSKLQQPARRPLSPTLPTSPPDRPALCTKLGRLSGGHLSEQGRQGLRQQGRQWLRRQGRRWPRQQGRLDVRVCSFWECEVLRHVRGSQLQDVQNLHAAVSSPVVAVLWMDAGLLILLALLHNQVDARQASISAHHLVMLNLGHFPASAHCTVCRCTAEQPRPAQPLVLIARSRAGCDDRTRSFGRSPRFA
jgi:hypothetical protein